jgi:hypothetical protein
VNLYFDLEGQGADHVARWEARLQLWFAPSVSAGCRVFDPRDADAIIVTARTRPWNDRLGSGFDSTDPEKTFAWDCGDFPSGRLAGLYAGLPLELFETGRHRTFCYALRWNAHIRHFPPEDARLLFGFRGCLTSPLRYRMKSLLAAHPDGLFESVDSLWHRMDDPASTGEKQAYAEQIRQCRFVLCPRGNGVSSVRLFEVLESGRVPVILSDRFVPPVHPGWNECTLHLPESKIRQIPDILREVDRDWPGMAARARAFWETHYSETHLLENLVEELKALKEHNPRPGRPSWSHRIRFSRFATLQGLKDGLRRLRTRIHRT